MVRKRSACWPWAKTAKRSFFASIWAGVFSGRAESEPPLFEDRVEAAAQLWGEVKERLFLVLQIFLVFLAIRPGDLLVVSGQCLESLRWHTLAQLLAACETDDGVAALDMVVEEIEGLARNVRFQPQGHLAQLHRQRVHIDAVDAVADHVSRRATR